MAEDLLAALALVLVIEGLLPALSPRNYRQAVETIARTSDATLRGAGLTAMAVGALLVWLIRL